MMTFEDPKKQQSEDMQEDQRTGSLGGEATDEISETDYEQPVSDEDLSETDE